MKLNRYEIIIYSIILLIFSFIDLILILGLFKWELALSIINWAKGPGFLFSAILFIILFVLAFSSSFALIINREKTSVVIGNRTGLGDVMISVNGIKSSIREIAGYFSEIQDIRPEIEIIKDKIYITLRIKIPASADITRIVNEMQQRLKVYFESVLPLNLEKINVIIDDVVPSKRGK
uniref:Alkaline shock response membrane anchor protein AmaP n=1 Tax=Dictyoglomus thermophilum TaxID=14 RepID=A0A7C3MMX3_DICTH